MTGIDVQIIDEAPAAFEVALSLRGGERLPLERDDPDRRAIEELSFDEILRREVGPLPSGAIRVVVGADEFGAYPGFGEIASAVARRILN